MKQVNQKVPAVFYAGLVLLCVTLITWHFTSGLYARYSTSASGSDRARVAVAVVTASGAADDNQDDLIETDDDYKYIVTVSNQENGKISEVTLEYTIYVEMPETPILDVSVSGATKVGDNTTGKLAFKADTHFLAGEGESRTHIVTIKGSDATVGIHNNVEIKITVKAEQVD